MKNYIDCSTVLTEPVIQALKKANISGVCRYLVPDRYSKHLRQSEVDLLVKYGVRIVSIWETYADRINGGSSAGEVDSAQAVGLGKMFNMPQDSAIYYTCDFDTSPKNYDAIEQYLLKAREIHHGYYKVGIYAEYSVIEEMYKRGAADCYWQTYAWSGGKVSKHANLYQYKNGQVISGVEVDMNYCYGGEGSWGGSQTVTRFPDVPVGSWAEDAIKWCDDKGYMVGYPDGTFGYGKPIVREEVAALIKAIMERR